MPITSNRRNRREPSKALAPPTTPVLWSITGWTTPGYGLANAQLLEFAPDPTNLAMDRLATVTFQEVLIAPPTGHTMLDAWFEEATGVATLFVVCAGNPFEGVSELIFPPWQTSPRGLNGEWMAPVISLPLNSIDQTPWVYSQNPTVGAGNTVEIPFVEVDNPNPSNTIANPPDVSGITLNGVPAISSTAATNVLTVTFPSTPTPGDILFIPRRLPGLPGPSTFTNVQQTIAIGP